MYKILAIAALTWLAAACTQRAAPYRFRGPLVSGVHAAALPPPDDRATPMDERDERDERGRPAAATRRADRPTLSPKRKAEDRRAEANRGGPLAGTLRSMVGLRERKATPLSFALSALSTLGADLDEGVRDLPDSTALVAFAQARGATSTNRDALLGDLIIFENIDRSRKRDTTIERSSIGVVVAVDPDGTIELIYLARGIIRRGYMTLHRAHEKRDEHGRVLNTIVRQKYGNGRKGRSDLTAERFHLFVHLDGLSAR